MDSRDERAIAAYIANRLRDHYSPEDIAAQIHAIDWLPLLAETTQRAAVEAQRRSGDERARFMTHAQPLANGCLVWAGTGAAAQRPFFLLTRRPDAPLERALLAAGYRTFHIPAAVWLYLTDIGPLPVGARLRRTCATANCVAPAHHTPHIGSRRKKALPSTTADLSEEEDNLASIALLEGEEDDG